MAIFARTEGDHDQARELMGRIKDATRAIAVEALNEHHVHEEEDAFFEQARKVVDATQAKALGRRCDDRRMVVVAALTPVEKSG